MWGRVLLPAALLAAGCASNDVVNANYLVTGEGPGDYRLQLSGHARSFDSLKAELTKRAAATCGGAYRLTDEEEIVTICTDDCDLPITLIAKLHCGAAA